MIDNDHKLTTKSYRQSLPYQYQNITSFRVENLKIIGFYFVYITSRKLITGMLVKHWASWEALLNEYKKIKFLNSKIKFFQIILVISI